MITPTKTMARTKTTPRWNPYPSVTTHHGLRLSSPQARALARRPVPDPLRNPVQLNLDHYNFGVVNHNAPQLLGGGEIDNLGTPPRRNGGTDGLGNDMSPLDLGPPAILRDSVARLPVLGGVQSPASSDITIESPLPRSLSFKTDGSSTAKESSSDEFSTPPEAFRNDPPNAPLKRTAESIARSWEIDMAVEEEHQPDPNCECYYCESKYGDHGYNTQPTNEDDISTQAEVDNLRDLTQRQPDLDNSVRRRLFAEAIVDAVLEDPSIQAISEAIERMEAVVAGDGTEENPIDLTK